MRAGGQGEGVLGIEAGVSGSQVHGIFTKSFVDSVEELSNPLYIWILLFILLQSHIVIKMRLHFPPIRLLKVIFGVFICLLSAIKQYLERWLILRLAYMSELVGGKSLKCRKAV